MHKMRFRQSMDLSGRTIQSNKLWSVAVIESAVKLKDEPIKEPIKSPIIYTLSILGKPNLRVRTIA